MIFLHEKQMTEVLILESKWNRKFIVNISLHVSCNMEYTGNGLYEFTHIQICALKLIQW